eukprot:m.30902 g.30902  ORF g.30902 m.30902 type:complete len:634 (-) comp13907_c0_seq2:461-2362(-)
MSTATLVLAQWWLRIRRMHAGTCVLIIAILGLSSVILYRVSHDSYSSASQRGRRKMDTPINKGGLDGMQAGEDNHPPGGVEEMEKAEERLNLALRKANSLLKQTLPPLVATSTTRSREQILNDTHLSAEEEAAERKAGFDKNRFEQYISDRLSLHRPIRDPRSHWCRDLTFDISKLPDTSVVIVFHNEARSTLLRTVWTVLDRSPPSLVREIILVDDASTMEHLKQVLADEVQTIPKTRLIRLPERSGLIRAKVAGAQVAKGKVLTFLDSHCECNTGWLEPLLHRISENRSNVATPTIDAINAKTFEYQAGKETTTRGVFSWTMTFTWLDLPYDDIQKRTNPALPLASPTMAGGLFSIDRQYFFDIGSYDLGMDVWGGENLEMSFRIWQCGGRIDILPCSRVGHVFRDHHPYSFPGPGGAGETINRNLNRVAEVWLDSYKELYYDFRPNHRRIQYGNITDRQELRKRLQCKSFQWYLDNVYPDMFVPLRDNVAGKGAVRNAASGQCLDSTSVNADQMKPRLVECGQGSMAPTQLFFLYKKLSQLLILTDFSARCIDASHREEHGAVEFYGCHGMKGNQEFQYTEHQELKHVPSQTCLTAYKDPKQGDIWTPVMDLCDPKNEFQRWTFSIWHDF